MKPDLSTFVGSRIRYFRKLNNLTQKQLGEKVGVKHNTISSYEKGTNEADQDVLFAIANTLDVSVNDFFPSTLEENKPTNLIEISQRTVRIPVLGYIACGDPILVEENFEDYRTVLEEGLPMGNLVYLKAKGDSMHPTIPDGSMVMIREQVDVENGEIAAVTFNGNTEATLKRVKKQGGMIILMPDNPAHEPIFVTPDNPVKIIGKAIKTERDL